MPDGAIISGAPAPALGTDAADLALTVSLFDTAFPTGPAYGRMERLAWQDFTAMLRRRRVGAKDGANFVPATFAPDPAAPGPRGVRRLKEHALTRTAIALDCETSKTTGEVPPAVAVVAGRLRALGIAAAVYTSHSHTPEAPRYRIVAPLSEPIKAALPAPLVLADMVGVRDVLDTSKIGEASLFYLPSSEAGQEGRHEVVVIPGSPLDAVHVTACAEQIVAAIEDEQAAIRAKAMEEAERRRAEKIRQGYDPDASIIEAIRDRLDMEAELLGHGYKRCTRGGRTKFLYPQSETGQPGVHVMAGRDGVQRVYSHHSGDPLAAGNLPTWCTVKAVDVVDVVTILDFAGDRTKALRELAKRFGIEKPAREAHAAEAEAHGPRLEAEVQEATAAKAKMAFPPAGPLPVLFFEDIHPVKDARDFVQGVLVEQSSAVVYGESNAGKTFWTTDLALHVAAGKTWNGRRVEQGGVVYCAMEGGNGFRNRVAVWRDRHCQPGEVLPFAAVPVSLDLSDPEGHTLRLIAAVKAAAERMGHPVKLIVIDTLSRALAGGNENDSEDMGLLVRSMDKIREETGACVLFIHHSGKDKARGARGHSLLRAAIDTEIEVRSDETTGAKVAEVLKQRDLPKGSTFAFRLETVLIGQNRHGEEVTSCLVEPAEGSAIPSRAQRRIPPEKAGWLQAIQEAMAEPEMPGVRVPLTGMAPTLTLTREQLRNHVAVRARLDADPHAALTAAQRRRLADALNWLKDQGLVGHTDKLVWLA